MYKCFFVLKFSYVSRVVDDEYIAEQFARVDVEGEDYVFNMELKIRAKFQ